MAKKKSSVPYLTTPEVKARIAEKFSPTAGYSCIFEVRDAPGFDANRTIDAVVMNLWPSRGLGLWGIEIKVSRGDWLAELKNPEKAEMIHKHVDEFYMCVGHKEIIKPGELPKGWGLIVPNGKKLKIETHSKHTNRKIDRGFVASLLKASQTRTPAKVIQQAAHKKGFDEGYERGKESSEGYWASKDREKLIKQITDFEEKSGMKFSDWQYGKNVGEALAWYRKVDIEGDADMLEKMGERFLEHSKVLHKLKGGDE